MRTSLNYHYRHGKHCLEIRHRVISKPAFQLYFDGALQDEFDSLEAAFGAVHCTSDWPPDGFEAPKDEKEWFPTAAKSAG